MKRFVCPLVAAAFALAMTPIFVTHGCGLSSWPIEWSIGVIGSAGCFVLVFMIKKKLLAWASAAVVAVATFFLTNAYFTWLHSDGFPDAFLDSSGQKWRGMGRRGRAKPNEARHDLGPTGASATPVPDIPIAPTSVAERN